MSAFINRHYAFHWFSDDWSGQQKWLYVALYVTVYLTRKHRWRRMRCCYVFDSGLLMFTLVQNHFSFRKAMHTIIITPVTENSGSPVQVMPYSWDCAAKLYNPLGHHRTFYVGELVVLSEKGGAHTAVFAQKKQLLGFDLPRSCSYNSSHTMI